MSGRVPGVHGCLGAWLSAHQRAPPPTTRLAADAGSLLQLAISDMQNQKEVQVQDLGHDLRVLLLLPLPTTSYEGIAQLLLGFIEQKQIGSLQAIYTSLAQ